MQTIVAVVSIVVEKEESVAEKLGTVPGLSVTTAYSNVVGEE